MNEQLFLALVRSNRRIIGKAYDLYCPKTYPETDHYQDVMVAAWQSYPRFRGGSKFSTWLYGIARNIAINEWRRIVTLRKQLVSYDVWPHNEEAEVAHVVDQKLAAHVARVQEVRVTYLISSLSEKEQELVLLYANGYSYKQISEILGQDENLLRVHMYRIKGRLYKKFGSTTAMDKYVD